MFRKSFFEKLLRFRCPACGATENNKIGFKIEEDRELRIFTVKARCKCGKLCSASSTHFTHLAEKEKDSAEDSFMAILAKS